MFLMIDRLRGNLCCLQNSQKLLDTFLKKFGNQLEFFQDPVLNRDLKIADVCSQGCLGTSTDVLPPALPGPPLSTPTPNVGFNIEHRARLFITPQEQALLSSLNGQCDQCLVLDGVAYQQ